MSEPGEPTAASDWQQENSDYLSAALAWLYLRLRRLSGPAGAVEIARPSENQPRRNIFRNVFVTEGSAPALPSPSDAAIEEEMRTAAEKMTAFEDKEPAPALIQLSRRFGLSSFEREVLLLCVGLELDTRVAPLCARIHDDPQRAYPTFALAMVLFDDPAWEALSPEGPLRFWRLIEINQPGAQPLTTSALRADERIVNFVKGLNYLDDRLAPLLAPVPAVEATGVEATGDEAMGGEARSDDTLSDDTLSDDTRGGKAPGELPPSQMAAVEMILEDVRLSMSTRELPVIQLLGSDGASKRLAAAAAATSLGLELYRLPADLLPSQPAEMETLIRLWRRESALLPVALYLDASEVDRGGQGEETGGRVNRFLNRSPGLHFLDTRENWTGLSRLNSIVEVDKPTVNEQMEAWSEALGELAGELPVRLAAQFNLNQATIRSISARAIEESREAGEQAGLAEKLWQACLMNTQPHLESLAQRIDAKATWEDIVLPEQELKLLRQIAGQVGQRIRVYDEWGFREKMNRGLGISALFAGPSGTGKTMAAEVIANALDLHLYRIDLSAVVSKYIGETEKNLRRLFDAAEDSGAILFFDEADALFGKRSEVKDSHDRYANIEINYLLQRMEAYRGLAILATNMKSSLDQAFVRRLRFIVNFPFPGPEQRKEIWRKAFPQSAPLAQDDWGKLDYDRLARYNLTGGSIHNIALNAAFLAAGKPQETREVDMALVLAAVLTEFRKMGQPANEAEFKLPPKPVKKEPPPEVVVETEADREATPGEVAEA